MYVFTNIKNSKKINKLKNVTSNYLPGVEWC